MGAVRGRGTGVKRVASAKDRRKNAQLNRRTGRAHERYVKTYEDIFSEINPEELPKKYRDIDTNYRRFSKPVMKAVRNGFKLGLDFGCGTSGCEVIGRLLGVHIIGMDIPVADGKESPYVPLQRALQRRGYNIILRDTTLYPWDFRDDNFDFVILYFSLNKEFMHEDTFNLQLRLAELMRVTKNGGKWFVWPRAHHKILLLRQPEFDKEKSITIEFGP